MEPIVESRYVKPGMCRTMRVLSVGKNKGPVSRQALYSTIMIINKFLTN